MKSNVAVLTILAVGLVGGVGFYLFMTGMAEELSSQLEYAPDEEPAAQPAAAQPPEEPQPSAPSAGAVVKALLEDLSAGEYEEAYERTTAIYRQAIPLPRFRDALRSNPYLQGQLAFDLRSMKTQGSAAQVEGTLTTPRGALFAKFYLTLEGERWGLTGILIGGSPVLPAF